jgi:predicted transcriptional regulator
LGKERIFLLTTPDPVFDAADKLARRLGISRSQLYTTAVGQFIEAQHEEAVTQALNEIYAEVEAEVDQVLKQMQLAALPEEEW